MTSLPIIVSLPDNDIELARAAKEAGASGLKVHINLSHRVSAHRFGTLDEERPALERILSLGLPTGIAAGDGPVDPAQIRGAGAMGFSYIDLYAAHAGVGYVADCAPAQAMIALGPNDHPAQAAALERWGVAQFELSVLPPQRYGTPLALDTLARLAATREAVSGPIVVPSQHALTPADMPALAAAGATHLLLGAIVLGDTPTSLARSLAGFVSIRDTAYGSCPHQTSLPN